VARKVKIKLQDCCKKSLEEIRRKTELGKLLKGVVGTSPLLTLLGSGPIDATFTIASTDWSLVTEATKSVDVIVANRCKQIAQLEALIEHGSGDLHHFWRNIADLY